MKYVDLMQPLAPCPFCGKVPIARLDVRRGGCPEYFFFYEIKCEDCKISMSKTSGYTESCKGIPFEDALRDMAEIIAKWDTRAKEQ